MTLRKKRRRPSRAPTISSTHRLMSWLLSGMPRDGARALPSRRGGPGPAMRVALLDLAAPRRGASIDGEDMNAFLYTLGLHLREHGALHHVDAVGGRFSFAFTHPDPDAFVAAVARDLAGYLSARHGWTGPVLDAPTVVSLFGVDEQSAALVGLSARATLLAL